MLRIALVSALMFALSAHAAEPRVDHLIPWTYGFDRDLRPLVEKKLFITPANCGRMIRMHQMTDQGGVGESVVSVYCTPSDCHVTLTRSARSLDMLWADRRGERNEAGLIHAVPVMRKDAELPRSAAQAFRECWRTALLAVRKRPDEERVVLDNDRVEFWLVEPHAAPLKAERPDYPGKRVESLISLGDRLARYCEMSASGRATAAQEIEREAIRLQSAFARKNASNQAMERTADRSTLHFLR